LVVVKSRIRIRNDQTRRILIRAKSVRKHITSCGQGNIVSDVSRWVESTHKGAEAGKFVLSAGKFYGDAEKDLGIQTSQDARFYALSAEFKPFSSRWAFAFLLLKDRFLFYFILVRYLMLG
jgi:hypothetical protein